MRGAEPAGPDGDGEVAATRDDPAEIAPPPSALEAGLGWAVAAAALATLARLARQAWGGTLATDECFHATAAAWIHAHRAIPAEFPGLYSGFAYYYQPLLHLLGALWIAAFGSGALLALPGAFAAALFLLLATGGPGISAAAAGLWAAALVLVNPAFGAVAVRLYAEPLVSVLAVATVALLFAARRSARPLPWIALGVVAGLGLNAKFSGWIPLAGLALTAAWDAARGDRARAARLALACALAVAIALPWLVRNQILFGSALYPAFAPDLEPRLLALNRARFSTPPAEFLAAIPGAIGLPILAFAAAAFAAAALFRRWTLRESVALGALAAMAATAFVPYAAGRHLTPFVAVLAWMGAWAVHDALAGHALARIGATLAVLAVAAHGAITLPDHRAAADPPAFLVEAFPKIAALTPPDARVLSLWTYDTHYHAARAATWPIPWGQRDRPLAALEASDPDTILARLAASGITDVLVPTRISSRGFDSANYPEAFVRGLEALERKGAARLRWKSQDLALLSLRPAARGSGSLAPPTEPPRR